MTNYYVKQREPLWSLWKSKTLYLDVMLLYWSFVVVFNTLLFFSLFLTIFSHNHSPYFLSEKKDWGWQVCISFVGLNSNHQSKISWPGITDLTSDLKNFFSLWYADGQKENNTDNCITIFNSMFIQLTFSSAKEMIQKIHTDKDSCLLLIKS